MHVEAAVAIAPVLHADHLCQIGAIDHLSYVIAEVAVDLLFDRRQPRSGQSRAASFGGAVSLQAQGETGAQFGGIVAGPQHVVGSGSEGFDSGAGPARVIHCDDDGPGAEPPRKRDEA